MGIFSFITDPINNLFGGGAGKIGPDPATQAIQAQTAATQAASAQAAADAAKALKAQQDANLIAEAASVPQADSESARASSDDRRRKLLQGGTYGVGLPDKFGAPPVGFRLLSGQ